MADLVGRYFREEPDQQITNSESQNRLNFRSISFGANYENIRIIERKFWYESNSWAKRKEIALQNQKKSDCFCARSYKGHRHDLLDIPDRQKIFKKNELGLSPLIYSIWGYEDNPIEKYRILPKELIKKVLNSSESVEPIKITEDVVKNLVEQAESLKITNELGHVCVHFFNNYSNLFVKVFIEYDLVHCLDYVIERKSFNLKPISSNIEGTTASNDCPGLINQSFLSLAIKSMQVKTLNSILKYIENELMQEETDINLIDILEVDLPDFLPVNSSLINSILRELFRKETRVIMVDSKKLPVYGMFDNNKEWGDYFNKQVIDIYSKNEYLSVNFLESKIKLPSEPGSSQSIELMRKLYSSSNINIYQSAFIRYYLKYKWDKTFYFIYIQHLFIFAILFCVYYIIYNKDYHIAALVSFWVWLVFFIGIEMCQIYIMGPYDYFGILNAKVFFPYLKILVVFAILIFNNSMIALLFYSIIVYYINKEYEIFSSSSIYLTLFILSILMWEGFDEYTIVKIIAIILVTSITLYFLLFKENYKDWYFHYHLQYLRLALCFSILFNNSPSQLIFYASLGLDLGYLLSSLFYFYSNSSEFYLSSIILTNLSFLILSISNICDPFRAELVYSYFILSLVFSLISAFIQKNIKIPIQVISLVLIYFIKDFSFWVIFTLFTANILDSLIVLIANYPPENRKLPSLNCYKLTWNAIDAATIIAAVIWALDLNEGNNEDIKKLDYILLFLSFIRGLTIFRCFDSTRFYVKLIITSFKDIFPFLCIFFYSTVMFGALWGIYQPDSEANTLGLFDMWAYSYDLNIGSPSHEGNFGMLYISFWLATVVNVIVMLNLLISVLGHSFDLFQVIASNVKYKEMAYLIYEVEQMMFWKKYQNIKKQIFVSSVYPLEDEYLEKDIKGTMSVFEKNIKNEISELRSHLEATFTNSISELEKRINGK